MALAIKSVVHEFYIYKKFWGAENDYELPCYQESGNQEDWYDITHTCSD